MSEIDLQRIIQCELSDARTRLWRNTNGFGWQGSTFSVRNGNLISGNARAVTFGLGPGSSDLIGPRSVIITPAMVGQKIAVFAAIETKSKRGKERENQEIFVQVIRDLGGVAGFARSLEDAVEIVTRLDRC